ncbi:hypothetical protein KQI86_19160 [Clostridium sp. MSJ-11]|uniref:Uncharacterized protein n=1 Tax=Clostridium mobile TaxID=2841512 RepID=A0ABS6EMG7_9CLOT|nr:hypothetical protein [Clostridium mobile]MBU5486423.1 hypothetical protein [Clostridium mobile]
MCLKNFLPLSRDIQNHWVYKDSEYLHVWVEMLFSARYSLEPKTDMHEGIIYTICYGEFIFGRPSWCKRLGITDRRMRTLLTKLIETNMIKEVKKYPKFTIYSILNFDKYNKNDQQKDQHQGIDTKEVEGYSDQQKDQRATSKCPASVQQATNKENSNIERKNNKIKYAEFVTMTLEEYKKLVEQHGEDAVKRMIDVLDNYKGANGKKYKSDYRAILNWVVKKVQEENNVKLKEVQTRANVGMYKEF